MAAKYDELGGDSREICGDGGGNIRAGSIMTLFVDCQPYDAGHCRCYWVSWGSARRFVDGKNCKSTDPQHLICRMSGKLMDNVGWFGGSLSCGRDNKQSGISSAVVP